MTFALTAPILDGSVARGVSTETPGPHEEERTKHRPLIHRFEYPAATFSVELWPEAKAPTCGDNLVEEAYSKLGYRGRNVTTLSTRTDSVTLHAKQYGRTTGTLTVNFDGPRGLNADSLYFDELRYLRNHGDVCEFTRLALDRSLAGKEVLCGLFYVAYVYSHLIKNFRHLAIEVNPRHAAFYARMLGFRRAGPERICSRVSAPAVLMALDFGHTREQIDESRLTDGFTGATLYRYAAPRKDELSLLRKMKLREGRSLATP